MIVVIPIHNQGKNLAHVLSAYMVQTVMPEHIILVCDRCTDISKDLASSFISKFAVFDCVLHVIDTNGSNVTGFGAGFKDFTPESAPGRLAILSVVISPDFGFGRPSDVPP